MKSFKSIGLSLLALSASAFLAACGSSDSNNLLATPATLTTLTKAQIDATTTASGLIGISGAAKCDVQVVSLYYQTTGTGGEKTDASGVMLVPAGTCATTPSALVAYAKGTDVQKLRTLANPQDPETFSLIAMFAAQGFTVVATDYLGFAKSNYPYHPYLHANSEATSVIDSIRAARNSNLANLSGKVMLTGYSQGGHSSAATQAAIEANYASEINVVAGAHLAGPYNLSGSFKLTDAIAGYQFFVPYLVTAYQKVYGDAYTSVGQAFQAPYSGWIENLLPSATLNYTTLVTSGKLPGINGETPNQARDALFQAAYITDVRTNNSNPLYLDAKKNDLLAWTPKAQTLLCGGAGDPTVPPAIHRDVLYAAWTAAGLKNVSKVDVDPLIQATFGVNGAAPGPTDPKFATYYGSYHGTYEPPFCLAAARTLFIAKQ